MFFRSKMTSKTTQNPPKRLPRASFFRLRFRPRFWNDFGTILAPKMPPFGHPFRCQNRSKKRSKIELQKRSPQERPKTPQELPRDPPRRPRRTQNDPKTPPWDPINVIFLCFCIYSVKVIPFSRLWKGIFLCKYVHFESFSASRLRAARSFPPNDSQRNARTLLHEPFRHPRPRPQKGKES